MTARPLYDLLLVLVSGERGGGREATHALTSRESKKTGGDTCRLILQDAHPKFVTSAPVKPFSHKVRREEGRILEAISS